MSINIETQGVHHLTLRSGDLERSRHFYVGLLGFPVVLEGPGIFLFLVGQTAIAVRGPAAATAVGDAFSPFRIGLDHVALGCRDEAELARVAAALTAAGVENTGMRLDPTFHREYVAFKDPDRIAWEFYMAPDLARRGALSYFEGLRSGDLDAIAFADGVRFESPLTPEVRGAREVRNFLSGVLPAILGVDVRQVISDGDSVAVNFELQTPAGAIQCVDWFKVVSGQIVEVRPYFDPRPLIAQPA